MRLRPLSLAANLLKVIGAGSILLAALIAPNALQAFKPLLSSQRKHAIANAEHKRIRETLKRLVQRRLIALTVKNGREYLEITTHGRKILRSFDFESIILPQKKKWDKKWRILLFDIPEKKRQARQTLQGKLREIGFYPLQRSVFVYPYPCEDEIDFLIAFLELQPFVIYSIVDSLGRQEGRTRLHFRLL